MTRRCERSREKNKQYDSVYYLRNREKKLVDSRERANREEQKIYRKLYARWRFALLSLGLNEPFDKPSKDIRLKLIEQKGSGCASCSKNTELELDHKNDNPNENTLDNLQWLCNTCHTKKTNKKRIETFYSELGTDMANLAAKKPWSKLEK